MSRAKAVIDEHFSYRAVAWAQNCASTLQEIIKVHDYQPSGTGTVVAHENQALRMAALLKMTDLRLEFNTIGGIDQLTLVRARNRNNTQ